MILIATIVALSAACGSELPTAPSPPPPPPPPAPTFTLTGTVMEARAEVRTPARHVTVEISPTHAAVTDSGGNFSMPGLAKGVYVVQVRARLYEPSSTTVRIDGDTRIDLEIVPTPVFAVSGIVYEDTEDGQVPVAGVFVNNSEIHDSVRTDATGAYRVLALRGVAQISFSKSGYVSQGRTIVMEGDVRLDVTLVRLNTAAIGPAAGAHDISATRSRTEVKRIRERSKRRRTLAPTRPGTGWRTFSKPAKSGSRGDKHAVDEVRDRSVMDVMARTRIAGYA